MTKTHELDRIDKELIYWMDLNSRASLSGLAKKMHTSASKLRYRLSILEKNGDIQSYITLMDYRKLGYRGYAIYYRLKEMSDNQRKKILDELKKNQYVADILLTQGEFDIQLVLLTKTNDTAAEVLWRIRELMEGYVIEEKMAIHLKSLFFPRYGFLKKNDGFRFDKPRLVLDVPKKRVDVDETDKKILNVLSDNANWPLWRISKSSRVKGPTVYSRIKKLEKNGIIIGYSIKMNPNIGGFKAYRVYAKIRNLSKERREQLMAFMLEQKDIYRATWMFGDYDLFYDARLSDEAELRGMLREVYSNFSKEVIRQDWVRVHDILKFGYYVNE